MLRWLLPAFLFLLHQYAIVQNGSNVFMQSYGDDLLVVPLCLGLLDFMTSFLGSPIAPTRRYSLAFLGVIWFAVLFEVLAPKLLQHGTSDPLDCLAYAAGALFYLWLFPEAVTPKPKRA